ncbi:MAG TPA: hypothetical protein VIQ23_11345 [Hanamia sp.]
MPQNIVEAIDARYPVNPDECRGNSFRLWVTVSHQNLSDLFG